MSRCREPCTAVSKSHCKTCEGQRGQAYYDTHRDEPYGKREAVREAAWPPELKQENPRRVVATKNSHDTQVPPVSRNRPRVKKSLPAVVAQLVGRMPLENVTALIRARAKKGRPVDPQFNRTALQSLPFSSYP